MSILAILAKLLRHQAQLAAVVANPQLLDAAHRRHLHDEALLNAAHFERWVAEYQISIKKRPAAPKR